MLGGGFAVSLAAALVAGGPIGIEASAPPGAKPVEIDVDGRMFSVSPDGQLLAVGRDGVRDLCVVELAKQRDVGCVDLEERQIQLDQNSIAWSPDSARLAFAVTALQTLRDGDLWLMNARGGQLTNITDDGFEGELPVMNDEEQGDDPIYVDVLPVWAPDGRTITFSRSAVVAGEFGGNVVASVDVASGVVETLVDASDEPGVVYWGAAWSPDGGRFFYSFGHPDVDDTDNGVWAYDVATATARLLVPSDQEKGPPSIVSVSSTGSFGLVRFGRFEAIAGNALEALAVADMDTGALQPVAPAGEGDGGPHFLTGATFAPGDDRLLYGLNVPDQSRYFVRDLATGGAPTPVDGLEEGPFRLTYSGGLSWASDGRVFVPVELDRAVLVPVD